MRFAAVALLLAVAGAPAHAADLDRYLPEDAQWVGQINVRQLLDAPAVPPAFQTLVRKALAELPAVQEVLSSLPIDPYKQIDTITLAGPLPPRDDRGLAIVRGKFDLARIQTTAEKRADQAGETFKVHKQSGFTIYQFTRSSKTGWPLYACFLDETTLVFAPAREPLAEAIARKETPREATLDKELAALVARADSKQSIWVAALATRELKRALGTSPETEKLFNNVQHFSGGLTVSAGLQIDALLQTRDTATAGELRQFFEGAKAILSLAAMDSKTNAPALTDLVKMLKVMSVKDAVVIRATITKEQLEKALATKP